MAKNVNEYEIYINGVFIDSAKDCDDFCDKRNKIVDDLRNDGYRNVESLSGCYDILVNECKGKSVMIVYRRWLGFYDINGEKIYEDDTLQTTDGAGISINQHWEDDREGEYYCRFENGDRWFDIDVNGTDFIKEYGIVIKRRKFDFGK